MEFCKSWKTRTAEELKAQVAESTHHGDYAFKSIEEVRLQMQTTIDLQAKEVAALRSDKAELLKKILAQDKDMVAMVEEAKTAAAEIRALQDQLREYPQVKEAAEEAEHLRGELETARSQVRTLRERLLESYDQGEQAAKDAVKHAWESHMPEYDLAWFSGDWNTVPLCWLLSVSVSRPLSLYLLMMRTMRLLPDLLPSKFFKILFKCSHA